jgi:16S rRNA processing protein RimM
MMTAAGTSVAWDDMIVVGRIVRPHGLHGHVVIESETDFPEDRFEAGRTVYARTGGRVAALVIQDARPHRGRLLVAFEGVESIEQAEAIGRGDVRIPPADVRPLPPGRFYHHELAGCEVVLRSGERLGRVAGVEGTGEACRLVVRGVRGELLVPLAEPICVTIDPAARRIVVVPPEGLLDLNA